MNSFDYDALERSIPSDARDRMADFYRAERQVAQRLEKFVGQRLRVQINRGGVQGEGRLTAIVLSDDGAIPSRKLILADAEYTHPSGGPTMKPWPGREWKPDLHRVAWVEPITTNRVEVSPDA